MGLTAPTGPILAVGKQASGSSGDDKKPKGGSRSNRDNGDENGDDNGDGTGAAEGTPIILRRTSTENNINDYLEEELDGKRLMLISKERRSASAGKPERQTANAGAKASSGELAIVTSGAAEGSDNKSYQTLQDKNLSAVQTTTGMKKPMDLASPHTPQEVFAGNFATAPMLKRGDSARSRSKSVSLDGSASSLLGLGE